MSETEPEVDKNKIESLLTHDNFIRNELIDLVDEKDLSADRRKNDDMIDALMAYTWSTEEFQDLKQRFKRLQLERSPRGTYIAKIENIPNKTEDPLYEQVRQRLKRQPVEKEDGDILTDGFELEQVNEDGVSGIYWTKTEAFSLDSLNNLTSRERTYDTGFALVFDNDLLLIKADNYGKRGEVLSKFTELGIEWAKIGQESKTSEQLNEDIRDFEEDVREGLESMKDPAEISDYSGDETRELLEVMTVEIKRTGGKIKTANI